MCEEGVSQDIKDRKQKRDDPEEKEADGARETKAVEQDIYGAEKASAAYHPETPSGGRGGQRGQGQVTRSPEPTVRSLHFTPLSVGSR